MIRAFTREDAEAVVAILHESDPPEAVTAEGLVHWVEGQPERARTASWVAVEEEAVVAWARAALVWQTSAENVGELWAFVRPAARERGHATRLMDAAEGHLAAAGARVLQTWTLHDPGRRFLEARGYRPSRTERYSILDLRGTLPPLPEPPPGMRVVPLGDAVDRPRELHALDAEVKADVPETFSYDTHPYEDWVRETLEDPQLSREGSFVVLDGERPVALALVSLDPGSRTAANHMTGTLRAYRRRGLARLAKTAAVRWAAAEGFERFVTTNDERNAAMLALNESLGYLAVAAETQYLRDV